MNAMKAIEWKSLRRSMLLLKRKEILCLKMTVNKGLRAYQKKVQKQKKGSGKGNRNSRSGRRKKKDNDSETVTVVADVHTDGDRSNQSSRMRDFLNVMFTESNETIEGERSS